LSYLISHVCHLSILFAMGYNSIMFSQTSSLGNDYINISSLLDKIDNRIGKLGLYAGKDAEAVSQRHRVSLEILQMLDQVNQRLLEQQQENKPATADVAQFESLLSRLRKDASLFLREMGGASALQQMRQQYNPPPEKWWWYLDEWVALRRRQGLMRLLKISLVVALILAALVIIYQKFLTPDPSVIAVLDTKQNAQRMLLNGEAENALVEIDKGLVAVPDNPELLVLKGCVLERLARDQEAEKIFKQAESLYANPEEYLLTRGQFHTFSGLPQNAIKDLDAVIVINPKSAAAYMLMGQAYQVMNDYQSALNAFNQASALASEQNDAALSAQVKLQIYYLTESMSGSNWQTGTTETPTP
jgi:tetratricopeptide (TPR) repeat protein